MLLHIHWKSHTQWSQQIRVNRLGTHKIDSLGTHRVNSLGTHEVNSLGTHVALMKNSWKQTTQLPMPSPMRA